MATETTKCRYCSGTGVNSIQTRSFTVMGPPCGFCKGTGKVLEKNHYSDCAVHNAPALPVGPCDCGGYYAGI